MPFATHKELKEPCNIGTDDMMSIYGLSAADYRLFGLQQCPLSPNLVQPVTECRAVFSDDNRPVRASLNPKNQ